MIAGRGVLALAVDVDLAAGVGVDQQRAGRRLGAAPATTSRVRRSPSCSSNQSVNGLKPAFLHLDLVAAGGSSNEFGIVPAAAPSMNTSAPAPSALDCRSRRATRGARSSVG